jgi:hypothetical protein
MKLRKQIILFLGSILLIVLFFLLPRNHTWMTNRALAYWKDFNFQRKHLDPEYRRTKRYEASYTYCKQIAAYFERKGLKQKVLVLLPPSAYFKSKGLNFHVPEPAVFYYYTGLKTVWVNSADASKANWIVSFKDIIRIDSVENKKMIEDTIAAYKKYPVAL